MKIPQYKKTNKGINKVTGIVIGVCTAVLLSFLMTIGLAGLITGKKVEITSATIYVFVIRSVSTMLGCVISAILIKGEYLKVIAITLFGYLFVLLSVGIIFYENAFASLGLGLLSCLLGGVIACLLVLKSPRRKLRRVNSRK